MRVMIRFLLLCLLFSPLHATLSKEALILDLNKEDVFSLEQDNEILIKPSHLNHNEFLLTLIASEMQSLSTMWNFNCIHPIDSTSKPLAACISRLTHKPLLTETDENEPDCLLIGIVNPGSAPLRKTIEELRDKKILVDKAIVIFNKQYQTLQELRKEGILVQPVTSIHEILLVLKKKWHHPQ